MDKAYKIILASGSPRRQQFFKEFDFNFEIRLKEVEEVYPEHLKAAEITNYLSELKANAFNESLAENELLITSDTIVWHNNKALGKPKDYDDAFQILKSLSNSTHEVITSVCFKTTEKSEVIHEVTKVTFSDFTDEEIHYYLKKDQPFDKAGAYGIQDWIGLIGISKIEGSYTNVVGLPTEKVYNYLTKNFVLNK
ncbi:Maf-like protein [Flavobacterium sp.]|uniref:Maf-like protein n=1 Tax=Flavobacterium sp. TaxID=239 RepID=UPI002B4AE9CE|nr:Maf-like protein [Flavobacterium sp.]HLP64831.1 Maf-like protein [Flavobacterium sp.]